MSKRILIALLLLVGGGAGFLFWTATRAKGSPEISQRGYLRTWDATKAAAYLDGREVWWQGWTPAQKDHGTICISCHTALPYAMARPALPGPVYGSVMAGPEKVLMDSVEKRVRGWNQMAPFYSDRDGPDKAAQSRATEAVLNAVILASFDARQGYLRPITRTAFEEAWALQEQKGENAGGWKWQDFDLAPWESPEAGYQGAALLAVQAGNAPDGYAGEPSVSPYLERLRQYLMREYSSQPIMDQLYVLWASAKSPDLLTSAQRELLIGSLRRLQQPDGGWALSSLDPGNRARGGRWRWIQQRLRILPKPPESDGCGTGLVVLALEETGTSQLDPMLISGVQWLESHQQPDGSWRANSLNAKRDPQTEVGHFMTDAATGYAVMALEEFRRQQLQAAHL